MNPLGQIQTPKQHSHSPPRANISYLGGRLLLLLNLLNLLLFLLLPNQDHKPLSINTFSNQCTDPETLIPESKGRGPYRLLVLLHLVGLVLVDLSLSVRDGVPHGGGCGARASGNGDGWQAAMRFMQGTQLAQNL